MDKTLELITQVKFDQLKKVRKNSLTQFQTEATNSDLSKEDSQKFD